MRSFRARRSRSMGGRGCAPARRRGTVLLAVGVFVLIARARADVGSTGRWLKVGADERPAIVYAPQLEAEKRKPVIVMLHGMCDTPENECNAFHPAATSAGF